MDFWYYLQQPHIRRAINLVRQSDIFMGPKHCTNIHIFAPQMALSGFFLRDLLSPWQVDLYGFLPCLRVDPKVVLHLKEGKKKKDEEEKANRKTTLPWPGLKPTNSVSRDERFFHYAAVPCPESNFEETKFWRPFWIKNGSLYCSNLAES